MLKFQLLALCSVIVPRECQSFLTSSQSSMLAVTGDAKPKHLVVFGDALLDEGYEDNLIYDGGYEGIDVNNPDADSVIYDHFPKTGGTLLINLFSKILESSDFEYRKEFETVNETDKNQTFVIASIRNPCDYYVSLWSFGVEMGGKMMDKVKNHEHLYNTSSEMKDSPSDIALFREWLKAISTPGLPGTFSLRFAISYNAPRGFSFDPHEDYRLVWPASRFSEYKLLAVRDSIETFKVSDVDCYVNQENLQEDARRCLSKWENNTNGTVKWDAFDKFFGPDVAEPIVKRSKHAPCETYFDQASEDLVRDVDGLLFKKMGYASCCQGAAFERYAAWEGTI